MTTGIQVLYAYGCFYFHAIPEPAVWARKPTQKLKPARQRYETFKNQTPNFYSLIMEKATQILITKILSVFCINTSHAEIYKWVDEEDNVHFSDTPVNNNAE